VRDGRWEVRCHALGASSGTARLNIAESANFSSVLEPNAYGRDQFPMDVDLVTSQDVPIRRLDDVFDAIHGARADSRIFLKLDTQGFDLEVLAGAHRVLPLVQLMQIELSAKAIYTGMPTMSASLAELARLGFDPVAFFPVTFDRDNLRPIEFDALLVRGEPVSH
jgi:FkbM family methyltransferase